jgi:predicted deacetylase
MSRHHWARFESLIEEFGIHPILAVIPDNRDSDLTLESPDPEFWSRMSKMEANGATIALHGYRHVCDSRSRGLVPLHRRTEFAGVDEATQQDWIRNGLQILRGHGLSPRLWVAPRHGFDRNTLRALRSAGIGYLSDGFARVPFTRGGITWIPQQLWAPVDKGRGLWTICIHSNAAGNSLVKRLRAFLQAHAAQFTSFDRVVEEYRPRPLGLTQRVGEEIALWTTIASRRRRRHSRR